MNNDIAVEILRELWRYKTTDKYTEIEIRRALEIAIEAVNGLRPHGEMRLIDADAVIEQIERKANSGQWAEEVVYGMAKALYLVKKAPTIKTFTLEDIEAQYRKGLEKGLEEAETKKCPIFSDDEVKQPCVKSPCDTCNHMGEHDAVDPYGEPYCPIDLECENASRYEKKEGGEK